LTWLQSFSINFLFQPNAFVRSTALVTGLLGIAIGGGWRWPRYTRGSVAGGQLFTPTRLETGAAFAGSPSGLIATVYDDGAAGRDGAENLS
jgi:hypothetical protein